MAVRRVSNTIKIGLFIFSLVLLAPNFLPIHLQNLAPRGYKWEVFDASTVPKIQSIDDLKRVVRLQAQAENISPNSLEYARLYNRTIKQRFYHGYSHYSLQENWIAALLGKMLWEHLSAVVKPNDILKYPMAACSQQSIVLMECFKGERISFRKVGFDHHFAIEGKINNQWYFFDPDMEPDFSKVPRMSYDSLKKVNALMTIYENRLDQAGVKYGLANQFYGKENQNPAPNAMLFHTVTKILSKTLWLLPLGLVFLGNKRRRKSTMEVPHQVDAETIRA